MRAARKTQTLMEVGSKNQSLQGVSIKLCMIFLLSYIILTYRTIYALNGLTVSCAFDSVSLGTAPPPLASYEYPSLPITKNRQQVQCTIQTPHTQPHSLIV